MWIDAWTTLWSNQYYSASYENNGDSQINRPRVTFSKQSFQKKFIANKWFKDSEKI